MVRPEAGHHRTWNIEDSTASALTLEFFAALAHVHELFLGRKVYPVLMATAARYSFVSWVTSVSIPGEIFAALVHPTNYTATFTQK
jgi:hypothetical protein